MKKSLLQSAILAVAMTAGSAHAYTECTGRVERIWTGDGGYMWGFLSNGVTFSVGPYDPSFKNIMAMTALALMTDKTVTVRYATDGVPCNASGMVSGGTRFDVLGIYTNM